MTGRRIPTTLNGNIIGCRMLTIEQQQHSGVCKMCTSSKRLVGR